MDGIVNFLKPTGLTSGQAVGRVKKILNRRDVGHLGTLDPFAAGVLPIAFGKATRLFDYYLNKTKRYRAIITFGYDSDTLDSSGHAAAKGRVPGEDEVRRALSESVGTFDQVPPAYSAKSVNGVRAYALARQGVAPVLPPKRVRIDRCDLIRRTADGSFVVDVECSAGTYIRCIARDVGAKLGTFAMLSALIRTASGDWTIDQAVTETEFGARPDLYCVGLDALLKKLPRFDVPDSYYQSFSNGVPFPDAGSEETETPFTVYCRNELFGLGKRTEGKIAIATYLRAEGGRLCD